MTISKILYIYCQNDYNI